MLTVYWPFAADNDDSANWRDLPHDARMRKLSMYVNLNLDCLDAWEVCY